MHPAFPTPPTAPASDPKKKLILRSTILNRPSSMCPVNVLDVSGSYREKVPEGRMRGLLPLD